MTLKQATALRDKIRAAGIHCIIPSYTRPYVVQTVPVEPRTFNSEADWKTYQQDNAYFQNGGKSESND